MGGLLLEDVLELTHFVGDHAAGLLGFQVVDFLLVVLDLLVDILEFLLQDFGGGFVGDQLVLFLDRRFLLLLVQHFVDLDDFVFQFPISLFEFLDVLHPSVSAHLLYVFGELFLLLQIPPVRPRSLLHFTMSH